MNANDKWSEEFICPNGCTYMLNAKDERIEEMKTKIKKATELAEDFFNANDSGDYVIPVHLATYLCSNIMEALKDE